MVKVECELESSRLFIINLKRWLISLHAREKEEKLKTKKKKTGQAECEQRRHDDCITAKVDGLADYLVQPQLAIFFLCCG